MPLKGNRTRRPTRRKQEADEVGKASSAHRLQSSPSRTFPTEQDQVIELVSEADSNHLDTSEEEPIFKDNVALPPKINSPQSHVESFQQVDAVLARVAALRASIFSPDAPQFSISDQNSQASHQGILETRAVSVYESIESNKTIEDRFIQPPLPLMPPPLAQQNLSERRSPVQAIQTPVRISQTPFQASQTSFRASQTPVSSLLNRANWTNGMEERMLLSLQQSRHQGLQADGGFKSTVYEIAASEVSQLAGSSVSSKQLKSKFEFLKAKYRIWNDHLSSAQSGWSLNSDGIPEAGEDVMNTYFQAHPERKWCRHSKPKWIDHLDAILGDRLATGSDAFTIDAIVSGSSTTQLDDLIDPDLRESSRLGSEESSNRSSVSIPINSHHKRAASSAHPAARGGKLSTKEYLGSMLEGATGGITENIEKMVKILERRQKPEQSHIQQAMEILNSEFTNLSPEAIIECSDILSQVNRAEVFVHIRQDARVGYLNTLLSREGSGIIVQADDQLIQENNQSEQEEDVIDIL